MFFLTAVIAFGLMPSKKIDELPFKRRLSDFVLYSYVLINYTQRIRFEINAPFLTCNFD